MHRGKKPEMAWGRDATPRTLTLYIHRTLEGVIAQECEKCLSRNDLCNLRYGQCRSRKLRRWLKELSR